ncbi:MAG: hemerythrin domain-containing protein [Herminiimonas sp.]|nr:hemerythrin domain-containing protein [Herminiimonas sp.]
MSEPLFDTAPDFDQPIAVLKHCHDRIRKQLATLRKLSDHLPQHGADDDARKSAAAVLKYFNNAAPNHHQDEEHDLLPMLKATAVDQDAAVLTDLMPQILAEHVQMDATWQALAPQLASIAAGSAAMLDDACVSEFTVLYASHMEKEEGSVAPMAKRIFSDTQMAALGNAMRARRGIAS